MREHTSTLELPPEYVHGTAAWDSRIAQDEKEAAAAAARTAELRLETSEDELSGDDDNLELSPIQKRAQQIRRQEKSDAQRRARRLEERRHDMDNLLTREVSY